MSETSGVSETKDETKYVNEIKDEISDMRQTRGINEMKDISWKILDTYFKDNPYNLVAHHLDSYNNFFSNGIFKIFKENNPIRFLEEIENKKSKKIPNECLIYLGGLNGDKIYFGKPIINDVASNTTTFMYPNNARLRNMSYCVSIHYDVDIQYTYYDEGNIKFEETITLPKIYLGKFPIMLHSDLCVLKGLPVEARYNLGECNNDYGGYFIIDGKEKVIISQEKFANNMLYIREYGADDKYSHSAEIKSVSEDTSKPIRTTSVKIVNPNKYSNNQIVVDIPNVRKPIPLFILMRALGVESDKSIIEYCLLDIDQNSRYVDLFIPSIHDANRVFTQSMALEYIATFTKRQTVSGVLEILMNYFLAHVGVTNFLDKAYFVGYMVYKLLRVFTKEENPTDRDNFMFKRIELSGTLIYDLFREYYLTQRREIELTVDSKYYNEMVKYQSFANFTTLVDINVFKNLIVESGFKKAFKGNWGSMDYTKRIGLVQDLNRLSWYSFITHLRKINLNIDSTSKAVKPRLLNNSQYGYIDVLDSPDGGNIGYHKHLAISASVTTNFSTAELIDWISKIIDIKLLIECYPKYLYSNTKIIINGNWIGVVENPIQTVKSIRLLRRNGFMPHHISISFNYENNIIYICSDEGRLTRPIYYIDHSSNGRVIPSYHRHTQALHTYSWSKLIHGFNPIPDYTKLYNLPENFYDNELFKKNKSVLDYIDVLEENSTLIAMNYSQLNDKNNKYYTHLEIDPSLMLGVLGNSVIYPEHNQLPRNVFSCGQSRQAVSLYHSNYQVRLDKTGVVLNCGQIPLVKSRYLEYINKEQHPYGVNAIVAIMCYTGYNMEDAILINQGSVDRGIFRTSYYSTYESTEDIETDSKGNHISSSQFSNFDNKNVILTKLGHKYDKLDKYGLVVENTEITDDTALIGKIKTTDDPDVYTDESVFAKKGQLGYVDKSFITETENGVKLAKIRIREERIPAIGDKMASRAGQKGTIGLIIPEQDMPYTEDGIRPDIIINPHALPSRMTIAQLVETTLGKIGAYYGAFGDSTAFSVNGPNHEVYGSMLVEAGFHSSGNQVLYNGMNGEQIVSNIFIGPTYYMRLKHMVKDKINYRARGPRTMLTRQSVQGRANDGGLRIGEMERDAIMANGMTHFLTDTFLKQGDEYYMAVCNKTGMISIYNPNMNLFMSPSADGPLQYTEAIDGKYIVNNITRFGRSFSVVRVPYSFKLLMQELQVINVQMRIITDENVEQMMNMAYSKNINKLLKMDDGADLGNMMDQYITTTTAKQKSEPIPSFVKVVPDAIRENFINPIVTTVTETIEDIGKGKDETLPLDMSNKGEPGQTVEQTLVGETGQTVVPPIEEEPVIPKQISFENPNDFGNSDLNMIYAKLTPEERSHLEGLDKENTINVLQALLDKQNNSQNILKVEEEKVVELEKETEKTDSGTKKINISIPKE
jgi:DNA-directed RNA polymerase II subunit RPB2